MAGNGTFSKGMEIPVAQRGYKTICYISKNIVVLEKNSKDIKLPEESHTARRIYVLFEKDGSDVKAIAKYGANHKKIWEIHTFDHRKMGPHVHYWKNGEPYGDPQPLSKLQSNLLKKARNFQNGQKKQAGVTNP